MMEPRYALNVRAAENDHEVFVRSGRLRDPPLSNTC